MVMVVQVETPTNMFIGGFRGRGRGTCPSTPHSAPVVLMPQCVVGVRVKHYVTHGENPRPKIRKCIYSKRDKERRTVVGNMLIV